MRNPLTDHKNRRQRIKDAKDEYYKAVNAADVKKRKKLKTTMVAEKQLIATLTQIYDARVEREHECSCCRVRYPDSYWLDDDGTFVVRYEADHPNDIIIDEIPMMKLLEEAKQ